jgi:hypothetical protein
MPTRGANYSAFDGGGSNFLHEQKIDNARAVDDCDNFFQPTNKLQDKFLFHPPERVGWGDADEGCTSKRPTPTGVPIFRPPIRVEFFSS